MSFFKIIYYYLILWLGRIFPKQGIPVLLYHSVSGNKSNLSINPENFEKQLAFLSASGYQSITPAELLEFIKTKNFPKRKVLITFDDGFKDNYQTALPLLEKYNFKAIFFIVGKYIGGKSVYCSKKKDKNNLMMDSTEIKFLFDSGHIVANHFYSHRNLIDLPEEEIEFEFQQNFSTLDQIIPNSSNLHFVAYPRNKKNQKVIDTLRHLGAKLAFAGGNQVVNKNCDPHAVPRVEIYQGDSLLKFKAKLSPYYHRLFF